MNDNSMFCVISQSYVKFGRLGKIDTFLGHNLDRSRTNPHVNLKFRNDEHFSSALLYVTRKWAGRYEMGLIKNEGEHSGNVDIQQVFLMSHYLENCRFKKDVTCHLPHQAICNVNDLKADEDMNICTNRRGKISFRAEFPQCYQLFKSPFFAILHFIPQTERG